MAAGPTLLTTALAVAYVIVKPRSPDLAAHIFRAELFGREGFTIWNGQWYGGHHTPAYSILSPPLVWLLGPQVMGALAAIGATACFTELARRHFGPQRYRWGALWFGLGSASLMATNRLPFALGVAFALAAVLALQRDRRLLAPAAGRAGRHLQPRRRAVPGHGGRGLRHWPPAARACRSSAWTARRWRPAAWCPRCC